MFVSQSNNQAKGDVVAGSKTEFNFITSGGSTDELSLLYAKLKADGVGDPSGNAFCEKLQHYMAARTDGDVRGLEEKLKASDRLDQLRLAKELKEFAAKSIVKRQGSQTAQRIFTIVLDELHTNFTLVVTPAIQTEAIQAPDQTSQFDFFKQSASFLSKIKEHDQEKFNSLVLRNFKSVIYDSLHRKKSASRGEELCRLLVMNGLIHPHAFKTLVKNKYNQKDLLTNYRKNLPGLKLSDLVVLRIVKPATDKWGNLVDW